MYAKDATLSTQPTCCGRVQRRKTSAERAPTRSDSTHCLWRQVTEDRNAPKLLAARPLPPQGFIERLHLTVTAEKEEEEKELDGDVALSPPSPLVVDTPDADGTDFDEGTLARAALKGETKVADSCGPTQTPSSPLPNPNPNPNPRSMSRLETTTCSSQPAEAPAKPP